MLDLKWLRENPEIVAEGARRKRIPVDVEAVLEADATHRALLGEVETLRAESKARSKDMKDLSAEEREALLEEGRMAKQKLKVLQAEEIRIREEVQAGLLTLPMPPASEVPDGAEESENVEIRSWGEGQKNLRGRDMVTWGGGRGAGSSWE